MAAIQDQYPSGDVEPQSAAQKQTAEQPCQDAAANIVISNPEWKELVRYRGSELPADMRIGQELDGTAINNQEIEPTSNQFTDKVFNHTENDNIEAVTQASESGAARFIRNAKMLGRAAIRHPIVTVETVPGLNEAVTYVPPVLVGLLTRNVIATGLAAGIPTLALEWLGARAGSKLLGAQESVIVDNENDHDINHRDVSEVESMIDSVLDNPKLSVIIPRRGEKADPIVKVAVATYGGSIAFQKLLQRENPSRTQAELSRRGKRVALWCGAICTAEVMAVAKGIANWDKPYVIAPIVAGGLALWLGAKKLWKRLERNNLPTIPELRNDTEDLSPATYDIKLGSDEFMQLESELVDRVRERDHEEGIIGVWMRPNSKFANLIRAKEASYFGEVEDLSEEDEQRSLFLAIIDTRSTSPTNNRIVHGVTITGVNIESNKRGLIAEAPVQDGKTTGFIAVDQLIELNDFNANDFVKFYKGSNNHPGIDLRRSISVETNFIMTDSRTRAPKFNGMRVSDMAYAYIIKMLENRGAKPGKSAIFATVNRLQSLAFERLGINVSPLMGRTDFVTPESLLEEGRDSLPVAINFDEAKVRELFANVVNLKEYII